MRNKIKKLLCTCFLISVFSFMFFSCKNYGTDNFFYEGNKVDNRFDYFHELDDFETKINSDLLTGRKYKILVLADIHFGGARKKVEAEKFFEWLDSIPNDENYPKFCLILGDIVDHGYKEEYKKYCDFKKHIENKKIPVITILGNHDLYNSGWDNFKEMCYPNCSAFHFDTPGFSWYGIDTGTGNVGQKQFDSLKKAFSNDKKTKILITHYPLTCSIKGGAFSFHDSTEKNLLIDLFGRNNVKVILCGHLHQTKYMDLGSFREYGHPSFRYAEFPAWTLYEIDETDTKNPKITQLPRDF